MVDATLPSPPGHHGPVSTNRTATRSAHTLTYPVIQSDFSGTYPYRFILPLVLLSTAFALLLGPFYFPLPWLSTIATVQLLYALLGARQAIRAALVARGTRYAIQRNQALTAPPVTSSSPPQHEQVDIALLHPPEREKRHVFVVPNYNEALPLLRTTLQDLASHRRACERYVVVLAMEQAEDGAQEKATSLIAEFRSQFKDVFETKHVLDTAAGEVRGKAANVSFAVREIADRMVLEDNTMTSSDLFQDVLITVLDADARVHEFYTDEIDQLSDCTMQQYNKERKYTIYAPPVVFERNWRDVPAPSRVQDFAWAALASQNLATSTGLGFPLSVYTIPLGLCVEMGFWDTGEEAIAEDMHTFLKAFYQTDGKVKTVPVYIPVNLVNLQDDGWFKTCASRVVQAERHYRGVVDLAFASKFTLANAKSLRHWLLFGKVMETHLLPSVIPFYMMLAAPYAQLIQWIYGNFVGPEYFLLMWTQAFGVMGLFIIVAIIANYERVRRLANRELFLGENASPFFWLSYFWMTVNVFIYVVAPYVIASLKWLVPGLQQGDYKVAAKRINFSAESKKGLDVASREDDSSDSQTAHDKFDGKRNSSSRRIEVSLCAAPLDHVLMPQVAIAVAS